MFFYGLKKGEETVLAIGEGKHLLIKFIDMSEPNEDGKRTVTFEINGVMRDVLVQDKNLEVKTDRRLKAEKRKFKPAWLNHSWYSRKNTGKEGDKVKKNDLLLTVEAMKMETTFVSKVDGVVDKIYVKEGERVSQEDLLITFTLD